MTTTLAAATTRTVGIARDCSTPKLVDTPRPAPQCPAENRHEFGTETCDYGSVSSEAFRAARDLLFRHRGDYESAYREFRWPQLGEFNWALDWFDAVAAGNDAPALWVVEEDGVEEKLSFAE